MRQGDSVFVDSGAWIALALARDPLHASAREEWSVLQGAGAKLHTSVPVVIETFTFLDRNANREVALAWKSAVYKFSVIFGSSAKTVSQRLNSALARLL